MKKFICHAEIIISDSLSDEECDRLLDRMDLDYGIFKMIEGYDDLAIGDSYIEFIK